ncbi:MAG: hypothetical protein IGS49_03655 [Chlorogloeopsis fritschii C42_A2020_084]|uniref:hypothetical protein n=1 Tax=Chlorogloeopsis fritschii TaxID=1124 RepID=UPI001A0BAB1E|nr:hypothetical protein [Chlorogloeopsis fritschii]MBF2004570.1 hypothetical protein [Chlorogloeopsis fritschii C42_A2020_084]
MTIHLHSFIGIGKCYIQVENQAHHITGILRKITNYSHNRYKKPLLEVADSAYFECEEEGTITYYEAKGSDAATSGIWTYLVYDCKENEEKVFRDLSIDTSTKSLQELLAGQSLVKNTTDIYEYLKYQLYESEYLDVRLPRDWDTPQGKEIANLLLEEFKALNSLSLFAEDAGKKYTRIVINKFIQIGWEVLENGGTSKDFECCQHDILKKIKIDDIANLIIAYNDYRLWQAALPSKSKAVEYAFHAALNLLCRIQE